MPTTKIKLISIKIIINDHNNFNNNNTKDDIKNNNFDNILLMNIKR